MDAIITHYVNPQMFCFLTLEQIKSRGHSVNLIEAQLPRHCLTKNQRDSYSEKDYVIMHFRPLKNRDKYVRGMVVSHQNNEYLIWAIDYGFSINCSGSDLWSLPLKLQQTFIKIYWGGLPIRPLTNDWPRMAVLMLAKKLDEAFKVTFSAANGISEHGYNVGQLQLQNMMSNEVLNATDYLLERNWVRLVNKVGDMTRIYTTDASNDAEASVSSRILAVIQMMGKQQRKPTADREREIPVNDSHKLDSIKINVKLPESQFRNLDKILLNQSSPKVPLTARNLSLVSSRDQGTVMEALQDKFKSCRSFEKGSSSERNYIKAETLKVSKNIVDVFKKPESGINVRLERSADHQKPKERSVDHQKSLQSLAMKQQNNVPISLGAKPTKGSLHITSLKPTQGSLSMESPKPTQGSLCSDKLERAMRHFAGTSYTRFLGSGSECRKKPQDQQQNAKIGQSAFPIKKAAQLISPHKSAESLFKPKPRLLVHCDVDVLPIDIVTESGLDMGIQQVMREMGLSKPLCWQRYAWPHLMRGNSLLLFGSAKSGRSWCYLPTVCSLVLTSRLRTMATMGPLAILLTDSDSNASKLTKVCEQLLKSNGIVINTFNCESYVDLRRTLLNPCDILITSIPHFLHLMNERRVFPMDSRLKYFIVDDYVRMGISSPELLHKSMQLVRELAHEQLQLVIIAQHWHGRVFRQLPNGFAPHPLLLINDFLEAAIYGNIKLSLSLCPLQEKIHRLLEFLAKQKPFDRRTIIICNSDEELQQLEGALTAAGHDCIDLPKAPEHKRHQLLLISHGNNIHLQLPLNNFELVIHFSMATSRKKFEHRFQAVVDNIANLWSTKSPSPRCVRIAAHLMLDEHNSDEMMMVSRFLQDHHSSLPERMQQVLKRCRQMWETTNAIGLCSNLLRLLPCNIPACDMRHFLDDADFQDDVHQAVWQPQNVVRCRVHSVQAAGVFSVLAMTYKQRDHNAWQESSSLSKLGKLSFALNMHMLQDENRRQLRDPKMFDICILQQKSSYSRVRIIGLVKRLVCVKFLDEGVACMHVKPDKLFECHRDFKDPPPLVTEVRLLGMLSGKEHWSPHTCKWMEKTLGNLAKNQQVEFVVEFAILNVVYVKEVSIIRECPTLRTIVIVSQLTKELLRQNLYRSDDEIAQNLITLYNNYVKTKTETTDHDSLKVAEGSLCFTDKENQDSLKTIEIIEEATEVEPISAAADCLPSLEMNADPVSPGWEVPSLPKEAAKVDAAGPLAFLNLLAKRVSSENCMESDPAQQMIRDLLSSGDSVTHRMKSNQMEANRESVDKLENIIHNATIGGNVARPRVKWHQTLLQIELIIEQQLPQYQLHHDGNVLIYEVNTATVPQRCIFNLLDEVKIISEQQLGYQLHVKLAKQNLIGLWPTLLNSLEAQQHFHWLVYDADRAQEEHRQSYVAQAQWMHYLGQQSGHQQKSENEDDDEEDEAYGGSNDEITEYDDLH